MTRLEAIPGLQAKADALVEWFAGKKLPTAPFTSRQGHTTVDTKKFFEKQLKIMETYRPDPWNKLFANAYKELDDLKKYMENEESSLPDLHPKTV